ncbi:hypothetical protein [Luteibacter sp.]|uniref:hypothetical protein n=1 Tax=Luteibacter sp. TaxID=1886636 RepID=UPI002809542B|nr:hypothetical protein [Luteibacter sp.]MDQ8050694.1 hypothetical protein [Luteibacter sp.]
MKLNALDPIHREIKLHLDHLRTTASERVANYARALLYVLLGISALTYASTANAADIAAMPNAAGGEIVLTTDRGNCPDLYLLAYSRGDNGTVITGCWLPGTRYVLIKWSETGAIKLFAYDQFTPLVRQVPAAERRL